MTTKAAAQAGSLALNLLQTFFIATVLFIAMLVVGCLRITCWLSSSGHQWVSNPGDDMFIPAMPDQCQRCGKQRHEA